MSTEMKERLRDQENLDKTASEPWARRMVPAELLAIGCPKVFTSKTNRLNN
jgi:hypothetical protein